MAILHTWYAGEHTQLDPRDLPAMLDNNSPRLHSTDGPPHDNNSSQIIKIVKGENQPFPKKHDKIGSTR